MKSRLLSRLVPTALVKLLVFAFVLSPLTIPAYADDISDAKARVEAATTDLDKINALYQYARALNSLKATREERVQALEAMKQSLALTAKMEAAGMSLEPQSQLHYYAGYLALRLDEYENAIRFFDDAERNKFVAENATISHKGALLFRVRGEAKWKNYDYAGALADFNRAIELNGEATDYSQRARLYFEMGNVDAARADWAKSDKIALDEQRVVLDVAHRRARMDGWNTKAIDEFPFDTALLPFNTAIAQNPRAAAPLLNRANYLIRQGASGSGGLEAELVKAERDIAHALRFEPKSSKAYHLRALALWRLSSQNRTLNDEASAERILKAFSDALRNTENPVTYRIDIGDFWVTRAQALPGDAASNEERQKFLVNAMFNYSRALYREPQNSLARARRIRLEQMNVRPDANTLLVDSEAIARNGLTAAPETIGEAEAQQLLLEAETARAQALLQYGELTAAQKVLDDALQRGSDAQKLRLRGQIHVLRGRYDEAIADLEKSLRDQRGNAQSWWWLGLAQDGKGNTIRAKSAFDNAIRIDTSLSRMTDGTRYAAQNPTTRQLVMPPITGEIKPSGTPLQHKEAGNALAQKKDVAGALAEYSTALQIDPNFTDALNNRANIYLEQAKQDLALADIKRALEIEPTHRIAWLTSASIHLDLGDRKQALADLGNAVRYAETDERRFAALLARANLHLKLNDKTSAGTDITAAQKLVGDNADRAKQIAELQAALEK